MVLTMAPTQRWAIRSARASRPAGFLAPLELPAVRKDTLVGTGGGGRRTPTATHGDSRH